MRNKSNNNSSAVDISPCLTVDYELFGNGTGDIQTHMIRPTDRLLDFLQEKKIFATFFIEVAEILAFKDALDTGCHPMSMAQDFNAIIQQIKKMYLYGHDVQLHIHPQWFDVNWNGKEWQMPACDRSLLGRGHSILLEHIRCGKILLEELGNDVGVKANCRIFRAGSLHLDRTPEIASILKSEGFVADSSVARGYYVQSDCANIDYRDLIGVKLPYWFTEEGGVARSAGFDNAMLEIPVWSIIKRQYNKLYLSRIKSAYTNSRQGGRTYRTIPRNPIYLMKWLLQRQALLWDFCLLTEKQLIEMFNMAVNFHYVDQHVPLVMLGHSKELSTLSPLSGFIDYFEQHFSHSKWITLSQLLYHVLEK